MVMRHHPTTHAHISRHRYSCAHQGETAHAYKCAALRFVPRGCSLPETVDGPMLEKALGPRGSIKFVGDSLNRQLFISIACAAHRSYYYSYNVSRKEEELPRVDVDWNSVDQPCHGTLNCIKAGPHSGFTMARLTLPNGAMLILNMPN